MVFNDRQWSRTLSSSSGLTGGPSNRWTSRWKRRAGVYWVPLSRGRRLSLHSWQHFELMERRRRRQRPFQCGGAGAPRIVGGAFLAHERLNQAVDKDQHAEAGNVGAERRYQIPAGERVGIVDIAARHAR